MPINTDAPIANALLHDNGFLQPVWIKWFSAVKRCLDATQPFKLAEYTVSSAPNATTHKAALVFISDEAGGATVAFSDGINWRRVQDRAVIS